MDWEGRRGVEIQRGAMNPLLGKLQSQFNVVNKSKKEM